MNNFFSWILQTVGDAAGVDDEDEDDGTVKKSPDASTQLVFINPADSSNLPAGSVANIIVGFKNNGKKDFVVNGMEASFRYPQDYNYFIQNVSNFKFINIAYYMLLILSHWTQYILVWKLARFSS